MDRLTAMQVYRNVVTSGSFTQAAKQLRISAASASRHVSDLEHHLGAILLRRSSRFLAMTDVGETYFAYCCEILDRIDEVENLVGQTRAEVHGTLRLSMPSAFGMRYIAPLLPQFMVRYPQVEVDAQCNDQMTGLMEGEFDIAVQVTSVPDERLIARKIASVRYAACAAPAYLKFHGVPDSPQELREHDCLTSACMPRSDSWQFSRYGEDLRVPVKSIFRSNCEGVIRATCLAGKGIAILPVYMIEEDLQSGALVGLFSDYRLNECNVYAVYPVDGRNSARTGVFIEFLREAFAVCSPTHVFQHEAEVCDVVA